MIGREGILLPPEQAPSFVASIAIAAGVLTRILWCSHGGIGVASWAHGSDDARSAWRDGAAGHP